MPRPRPHLFPTRSDRDQARLTRTLALLQLCDAHLAFLVLSSIVAHSAKQGVLAKELYACKNVYKKERESVTMKERSTRSVPTSSWSSAVGSRTTSGTPLAMGCGLAPPPGEVTIRFFAWVASSASSTKGRFLDSMISHKDEEKSCSQTQPRGVQVSWSSFQTPTPLISSSVHFGG